MESLRRLLITLRDLFFTGVGPGSEEPAPVDFHDRYQKFRALLTANNNALQAMAELEKMYYGEESYRMADIRSKVAAILVNVYKMVESLKAMAPGRYNQLDQVFEKISLEVETRVDSRPAFIDGQLIFEMHEISRQQRLQVGDKMANLGEAASLAQLRVPPGFVLTATATRRFLTPQLLTEINRYLQVLDPDNLGEFYKICRNIEKLVLDTPVPAEIEELLLSYYARIEAATYPGIRMAMRSSALGEDSAGVSFAGLYKTILEVDKDSLVDAYRQVVASKYGPKAIAYRRRRGFRHEDIEMCVGCLAMVPALVSGVTYSRDPSSRDDDIVKINATPGYGRGVVDGTRQVDHYLVSKDKPYPLLFSDIRNALRSEQDGSQGGSLDYRQLRQLVEQANQLERHFGSPQDIEWSFNTEGELYLLQSRGIPPLQREEGTAQVEAVGSSAPPVPPLYVGGIMASNGVAAGDVVVVTRIEEVQSLPKDPILVLEYPLPEFAPLLSKAAGLIAEHGSEAGHLATVAREFGIPALFSVPGAREVLAGQSIITLNSKTRAIFAGKRPDILKSKPVRKDPMAGSPIQRLLTEALQHITPLNLHDPGSTRFKPDWCETIHDITRYCHEKSVAEMFRINKASVIDKRAAKKLTGGVPLDWSVINLADGFAQDFVDSSPTVSITQITSLPMQAICRGLAAVPWEGPPSVSASGFGAIIFQSAMRPDLDPAVASPLATKNYFMISKHFCNVSVRLGYHYAMIEAYLGDLLTENYVTFRFKGGAADLRRKAVRAKLLAEVLERYEFRVELRSDSLLARVKKKPLVFLEERLQILGYLIQHARQLDMVMNQPQVVKQYRQKFISDIEERVLAPVRSDHVSNT